MRKYIVGFLVGALLTVGTSVYGADIASLVGKKVQGEASVSVDGANIGKIVIIDGKSYAPVRVIGESAGYSVTVNGKDVVLSKSTVDLTKGETMTKEQIDLAIQAQTKNKQSTLNQIDRYTLLINDPKYADKKDNMQLSLDTYNNELVKIEQKLTDLQSQLAELQQ